MSGDSSTTGAGLRIVEPCTEAGSYRAAVDIHPVDVEALMSVATSWQIPAMRLGASCLLRLGRHIVQLTPGGTCSITRVRDVEEAEAAFAQAVKPLLTELELRARCTCLSGPA